MSFCCSSFLNVSTAFVVSFLFSKIILDISASGSFGQKVLLAKHWHLSHFLVFHKSDFLYWQISLMTQLNIPTEEVDFKGRHEWFRCTKSYNSRLWWRKTEINRRFHCYKESVDLRFQLCVGLYGFLCFQPQRLLRRRFRSFLQLLFKRPGVKWDERLLRGELIVACLRRFRQGSSVIVWELSNWWPGGKKICTFAFPRNAPVAQRILCEVCLHIVAALQRQRGCFALCFSSCKGCF